MEKSEIDKLAEYLMKGAICLFDALENMHDAEPFICMNAKTDKGKYSIRITREDEE